MRTLRDHLILTFGKIQPESFIRYINVTNGFKTDFAGCFPDLYTYRHYALDYYRKLTYEEIDNMFTEMMQRIKNRGKQCSCPGIFALLPEYSLHVLRYDGSEPVCKQSEKLNWRTCYLQLGQDLLTTAHLAYLNAVQGRTIKDFGWAPVIGTDDRRLMEIMKKGLAENHFHLNGSTRIFDLSWICLMNHPDHIRKFFIERNTSDREKNINERFEENLNVGISSGVSDNRMSWSDRLLLASFIRVLLFMWLKNDSFPLIDVKDSDITKMPFTNNILYIINNIGIYAVREIKNRIDSAKLLYGQYMMIQQLGSGKRCLDYAITGGLCDEDNPCRSLTGERSFMYNAFRIVYSGICNNENFRGFKELFYLYILLKTQFRHEIIQTNGRYGFKNFAKYQDRKDIIFESFKEYDFEAKNLSVNEPIKHGNVTSLELRISPSKDLTKQYQKIDKTDKTLSLLIKENESDDKPFFYVTHFPKLPEPEYLYNRQRGNLAFINFSRNYNVRVDSQCQAITIAKMLEKYNRICTRLRGFDACTFELECRPEVFATEFRFLRSFFIIDYRNSPNSIIQPRLSATYHVGEDFMDIIDGLRAIDEALLFLELKSGERLGHAMALGVNAGDYYKLKDYCLVLKKQDYLDNLVWALNKTIYLNINLPISFRQNLHNIADCLLKEIYNTDASLQEYYKSWQLRGDSPFLYRSGCFNEDEYNTYTPYYLNSVLYQYSKCRIREHYHPEKFSSIRLNKKIAYLYYLYHYDPDVKIRGNQCQEIQITDDYIKMAEKLQSGMQNEVYSRRINIECNPSSNVLIGPFDFYYKHPIFTFYPIQLQPGACVQSVSVNTDDQGVFDTSLQEEYALLECAIRKQKKIQYNDDDIYGYLERLRRNGFSHIFPTTTT